jgi:putative peptidoglycan lipid II flippase
VSLFATSIGYALESTLLPELVRQKEETGDLDSCRSIAAFTSCILAGLILLLAASLIAAPEALMRLFGNGFDAERIRIGSKMLWWLIPLAAVTMYKPMADIWATLTERYTLSAVVWSAFNLVTIPALLLSIPFIGIYAVAFAMSFGYSVLLLLFMLAMRGAPVVWRASGALWRSMARIGKNLAFSASVIASSALFVVVDRYFASRLPTGSVSAISYAVVITGILTVAANAPASFFLSRMTKLVIGNPSESRRTLEGAASMSMAWLIPISAFILALSGPIVSLIYGRGRFGANSVRMTSVCLAAYCIGFPFSIASLMIYRYAQAIQRMGAIVGMSFAMVALNAFLDWALAPRWGLAGLALATSVAQISAFVLYYLVILGSSLPRYLIGARIFEQAVLAGTLAFCAWKAAEWGAAVQFAVAAVLFFICLASCERLGFMPLVPQHWRPSGFAKFLLGAIKSYLG